MPFMEQTRTYSKVIFYEFVLVRVLLASVLVLLLIVFSASSDSTFKNNSSTISFVFTASG